VAPTNTPTHTPVAPTNTPTHTPVAPTNTPTHTPVAPTNTPTHTPVAPTNTPTDTPVAPTSTPTAPVPPTITATPIPCTTFVACGSVDPNTGGDISGLLPSGESIDVSFPPGAVTTTVTVLIQAITTPPQPAPDGDTVVGVAFDLSAIDTAGDLISHFNAPVTLTFGYLAGSDPTLMTFAFFDPTQGAQGAWVPLAVTNIDTTNQLITATTDHFTTFSVVGLPSPAYCTDAFHTDAFRGTGDINGNGHIDLVDFSIFAGDYGKTGDGNMFSPYSDMNCDNQANLQDFSVFATYYGR
jgi:hypothetical protein